jgi:tetratricopeptide (TPR) repeat protein
MPKWKSKRIQHWRLQCNRLITIFRFGILGFIAFVSEVSGQGDASFPTIKETPIQRIHSLEISRMNGLAEKAVPEYLELLNFPETKQLADFRLAEIYLNSNELTKAEIHAKAALESDKSNSDFIYLLIKILEKQYKYEEAWFQHYSLVTAKPRYISRYYDAISNCYKRENYSDALNLIQLYSFHFGKNDYSHRTQIECWLRLSIKLKEMKYVDSVLIENEKYVFTMPNGMNSWIAFQIRQLNNNFPKEEAQIRSKHFVENLQVFQKSYPEMELDLKTLQSEFTFLKNEVMPSNIFTLVQAIEQANNMNQAELDFKEFQREIQKNDIRDSVLDSLLINIKNNKTSFLSSELHILLGNEFYKRGNFKNALDCYAVWKGNESNSKLIFELNETENSNNLSTENSDVLKNDPLSIQNRLIVCKYKMGILFDTSSNISVSISTNSDITSKSNSTVTNPSSYSRESSEFDWYEINYPFLSSETEIVKDILWNQLTGNWIAAISLWNSTKSGTSIYPDFYFVLLDAESHSSVDELNFFKQYSFEIAVNNWVAEGKMHPKLAQELMSKHKKKHPSK